LAGQQRGLNALPLLARIEGYAAASWGKLYYAKGNYFICQGQRPFDARDDRDPHRRYYPSQLFNARMLRICQSQIRLF
jgi:hypothetical protein